MPVPVPKEDFDFEAALAKVARADINKVHTSYELIPGRTGRLCSDWCMSSDACRNDLLGLLHFQLLTT